MGEFGQDVRIASGLNRSTIDVEVHMTHSLLGPHAQRQDRAVVGVDHVDKGGVSWVKANLRWRVLEERLGWIKAYRTNNDVNVMLKQCLAA